MKHIKIYERYNFSGCYWLIPTDDRYEDSMKKIGAPDRYIDRMSYFHKRAGKYVFIIYDEDYADEYKKWGYNEYRGKLTDNYCEDNKFKFKGLVNIPEYELEAEKYNL